MSIWRIAIIKSEIHLIIITAAAHDLISACEASVTCTAANEK